LNYSGFHVAFELIGDISRRITGDLPRNAPLGGYQRLPITGFKTDREDLKDPRKSREIPLMGCLSPA